MWELCYGRIFKSKIWCNKIRLKFPFIDPFFALILILNINVCITCIVYDYGVLWVIRKIQVMGFVARLMSCSQLIYELNNPYETIVFYLIIGGITCFWLSWWLSMMSVLMCIVIHWTRTTINHNMSYRVVMIHQTLAL